MRSSNSAISAAGLLLSSGGVLALLPCDAAAGSAAASISSTMALDDGCSMRVAAAGSGERRPLVREDADDPVGDTGCACGRKQGFWVHTLKQMSEGTGNQVQWVWMGGDS